MGKINEALNKASVQRQPLQEIEPPPASEVTSDTPARREALSLPSSTSLKEENSLEAQKSPTGLPDWEERIRLASTPSSAVAENFRKLRTKILHPDQGAAPRTVLITSAVPAEGKGFVTANLGLSIAQSAEMTCTMIDCDLRRSGLGPLFAVPQNVKGLANYLNNEIDWPDAILLTGQDGLSLVPSGPSPENPSELIDSSRMFDLIQNLSTKTNELFLLDSPPLHAAAETAVLAKMVDKVLVVVRWGTAGREQVKSLIETVGREKIIGIVFNAFEQNTLDSMFEKEGYYGYYGYYGRKY